MYPAVLVPHVHTGTASGDAQMAYLSHLTRSDSHVPGGGIGLCGYSGSGKDIMMADDDCPGAEEDAVKEDGLSFINEDAVEIQLERDSAASTRSVPLAKPAELYSASLTTSRPSLKTGEPYSASETTLRLHLKTAQHYSVSRTTSTHQLQTVKADSDSKTTSVPYLKAGGPRTASETTSSTPHLKTPDREASMASIAASLAQLKTAATLELVSTPRESGSGTGLTTPGKDIRQDWSADDLARKTSTAPSTRGAEDMAWKTSTAPSTRSAEDMAWKTSTAPSTRGAEDMAWKTSTAPSTRGAEDMAWKTSTAPSTRGAEDMAWKLSLIHI